MELLVLARVVLEHLAGLELVAVLVLEAAHGVNKAGDAALAVVEHAEGAAHEGREAGAEDHADVAVERVGDDALLVDFVFGLGSSAGRCSGDGEEEAAFFSKSSRRFLSFFPGGPVNVSSTR